MKRPALISSMVLFLFFCPSLANSARQVAAPLDIVLVLDNSGSMEKNDPQFLTRNIVMNFLQQLTNRARLAAIIFDKDARVAVPLTKIGTSEAKNVFMEALKEVDYKGRFTDSPAAIEKALYELKTNGRKNANKLIIFLTDGIVDTGDKDKDLEKLKWLKEDLALESKNLGVRIFGVAFTEDADFLLIQSLAVQTKGEYFKALKAENIQMVFDSINKIIHKRPDKQVPIQKQQLTEKPKQKPTQPPRLKEPTPTSSNFLNQPVPLLLGVITLLALFLLFLSFRKKTSTPVQNRQEKEDESHRGVEQIPTAYLIDQHNIISNEPITLRNRLTRIGRGSGNDIHIPEDTVSTEHAVVEFDSGSFFLEDLQSSNGTLLEGARIESHRKYRLKHGAKITIDAFDFILSIPELESDDPRTILRPEHTDTDAIKDEKPVNQPEKDFSPPEKSRVEETLLKPGMCPNHHTIRATEMCFICKKAFCASCVTDQNDIKICFNCSETED